jgi:hypothetical protein
MRRGSADAKATLPVRHVYALALPYRARLSDISDIGGRQSSCIRSPDWLTVVLFRPSPLGQRQTCLGGMMFGDWGTKDHDESLKISSGPRTPG